jgi:predicted membrane protein
MKYAGWIATLAILISLIGALEIIYQLRGNEIVVEIASLCIFLVWVFLAWNIAKWADREVKSARKQEL